MIYRTLTAAALAALVAGPVFASHANPWATEDDQVLAKNHEENQARSIDTPGEDEMRGVMTRSAHGKLGTTPAQGAGAGGGAAGQGRGGGGHGAGHGGRAD